MNRRALTLLARLADDPHASIPAACRGWSETDAAYKFFANPKTNAQAILAPHHQATIRRCAEEPVVLLAQDTTELDYTLKASRSKGWACWTIAIDVECIFIFMGRLRHMGVV